MADLTSKEASQSVVISGANPSTGVESNYLQVDSNGSAQINLRDSAGVELGTTTNPLATTPVESDRYTYSASSNFTAATTPTDVFTIGGAANKLIKITKIIITARTTSGSGISTAFELIKRSAANTAGTSSVLTNVAHDSTNPSATATVRSYTANPSGLGASVGIIRCVRIAIQPSSSPTPVTEFEWGGARAVQSIVLRSASEFLCVNFTGVTITGNSTCISVEWTEEDA